MLTEVIPLEAAGQLSDTAAAITANRIQGHALAVADAVWPNEAVHGNMSTTAMRPISLPSMTTGTSWPGLKICRD